ncbi:MAG: S-layer homology domain-containing protein [Oscillospiraceae bacterium]|nr:S-layer homology domain-containing protein [Oscillospiraceae bacterium]
MTKRTISWLLSLMMVVSLFAGTLTGANAANGLTIDPPSDVIYQTGSAAFTVSTVLDSLIDRIGRDKDFDLSDLVNSLKDEGLNVNTLTDMLADAGFDWNDIIGSLTGSGFDPNDVLGAVLDTLEGENGVNWNELIGSLTGNGFSMDQISGALLDRLEGGDINLEELISSLTGNEVALTDLLNELKNKGFDMDSIWNLIGGNPGGSGGGLSDLIGDLIGRFGRNSTSAAALSVSDDPEEDSGSVTTVVASNLKEKLREKYGDLFTGEKEKELDDLFLKIDNATDAFGNISLTDAVSVIVSNENFDLAKTVDVIMGATNGMADYGELVSALQDSTGSDLGMSTVADAFSKALGDDVDWSKLAGALKDNLGDGFDANDFLAAIGSEDTDLSGVAGKISEALGMQEGAIDADAVKSAITAALSGEDGFNWDTFAAAMGEDFDSDAFLQSVAEKLGGEGTTIDADAVSDAIEAALGEQSAPEDYTDLAKALKDAMGEDFSVEKLTEALTNALKGEDGEAPALDSIVAAVKNAMGGELTPEQITELVKGLKDGLGEDLNISDLTAALTDVANGDIEVSQLLTSLKEALGNEEFELKLDEIVNGLLGEGTDLGELVSALKDLDFSTGTISDLLFGGDIKYVWYVRTGTKTQKVSSNADSNIYSGEQTRTLSVSRTTVPLQNEEYFYFCIATIGHKNGDTESEGDRITYTSPEAKLTILKDSAPVETTEPTTEPTTQPTAQPTGPVLDNVTHNSYLSGYPDGTVHPNAGITRAEVATIIYRLMTEETRTFYYTRVNAFSDVPSFEWFNDQISTLARASVLGGYPDGSFHPNSPITRAELATILTRLTVLEKTETEVTPVNFKDLAGHWAAANIRNAAANGWVNGYPDGTFRPDQNVTRAEAVTMVNRMLGRNPSVLTTTAGMKTFSDNDPAEWYYIAIQEAANGHDYVRGDDGHEMWLRIKNT